MQRIRYKTKENGVQVSPEILAGTRTVVVNLLEGHRYVILDSSTSETLLEGQGKSRQELLKLVRGSLESLGVVFEAEVRKERTKKTVGQSVEFNSPQISLDSEY